MPPTTDIQKQLNNIVLVRDNENHIELRPGEIFLGNVPKSFGADEFQQWLNEKGVTAPVRCGTNAYATAGLRLTRHRPVFLVS